MLFKEINELKWKYFFIFLLLSVATIVIILLLSAALTKPLQLLEKKMRAVVASNLKVSLPGNKYKGELHSLADSFNVMVGDMNSLLDRLKIEVKQREATRFQVLLSQMNPHFLLNTLNTIKSISARHHDDDIHEICLSLGRILEVSLNTELDLIYLGKEMEIVTAYIQIQSSRFDYDIEVKYNMDESFHYALVPKFCLQPLVENALIHGFEHMSRTGTIQVSAHAAQHNLLLVVEDNGVGRQEERGALRKSRGNRVGLQNIRERLFLLFKKEADLVVDYPEQGGCRVQITIPLLLSNPNQKGE